MAIDIDVALDLIAKLAAAVHHEEVEGPWIHLEQSDEPGSPWLLSVRDQNDESIFEHNGQAYLSMTVSTALEELTKALDKRSRDYSGLLKEAKKTLGEPVE